MNVTTIVLIPGLWMTALSWELWVKHYGEKGYSVIAANWPGIEGDKDPQLQANNIVVPLEGAGENIKLTVSSPIQVHGVAKVAARRAPDLGEHNAEVLQELGFDAKEIERLRAGGVIATAVDNPKARAA